MRSMLRLKPLRRMLLLTVVLAGSAAVAHAQPAATRPAEPPGVMPAEPQTRNDFVALKLAFYRRTYVEGYRQSGRHDPAWDAAAEEMLEGAARYFANENEQIWYAIDHPSSEALLAQCERLTGGLGCDDPQVLFFHGWFARQDAADDGQRRAALDIAMRAYETMRDSGYGAYMQMNAASGAAQALEKVRANKGKRPAETTRINDEALAHEIECFTGDAFLPEEERVLLDILWWKLHADLKVEENAALLEAIDKSDAHEWAKLIVKGETAITAAWEARGKGWANTVTPEGWKGFGEQLTEAGRLFGRAALLHPERPEGATGMIVVALGDHAPPGTDAAYWFGRAIRAQVDHELAWARYFNSMLPRWGGSHERMLEVGRAALATGAFDTSVPLKYADQVALIAKDFHGDWRPVAAIDAGVWPDLERMYAGIIPPLVERKVWNANGFSADRLATAWAMGEWEAAARLAAPGGVEAGVDDRPYRAWAFAKIGTTAQAALAEVAARVSPARVAIARAEAVEKAGPAAAADAAWGDALKVLPEGDPGRPFVEAHLRERAFLQKLADAAPEAWVDVPADLASWDVVEGEWRFDEEGKLHGRVVPSQSSADPAVSERAADPSIVFRTPMPAAYQMRAWVAPATAADGQPGDRYAGLIPGWGTARGASLMVDPTASHVRLYSGVGYDWRGGLRPYVKAGVDPVLRIDADEAGDCSVRVGGKVLKDSCKGFVGAASGRPRRLAVATYGGKLGDEFVVYKIQVRLRPAQK